MFETAGLGGHAKGAQENGLGVIFSVDMNRAELLAEAARLERELYELVANPVVAPAVPENESGEDVCRRLMKQIDAHKAYAAERERIHRRTEELMELAAKYASDHPEENESSVISSADMNKAQLLAEADRITRDMQKLIANPIVEPAAVKNESKEDAFRRLMEHIDARVARDAEHERLHHRAEELLKLVIKHADDHPDEECD